MADAAAEAAEEERAAEEMPLGGEGYEDGAVDTKGRRRCMCLGNCVGGKQRHEAGQCGKLSVADRPLCSGCKAHKGSSQDRPRSVGSGASREWGAHALLPEGAEGEAAGGGDGRESAGGPDVALLAAAQEAQGARHVPRGCSSFLYYV